MPIIKITKSQLRKAAEAHAAALEKDPDFKAFHKELEREDREAIRRLVREERQS